MIPANVDQFLCCGTSYRAVRDAVAKFLLENTSATVVAEIQVRQLPELKGMFEGSGPGSVLSPVDH